MRDADKLLEELCAMVKCAYMSDLHHARYLEAVSDAVRAIPRDKYSAEAWREVARYILGDAAAEGDAWKMLANRGGCRITDPPLLCKYSNKCHSLCRA